MDFDRKHWSNRVIWQIIHGSVTKKHIEHSKQKTWKQSCVEIYVCDLIFAAAKMNYASNWRHIDGLVQEKLISNAKALELRLSYTSLST